MVIYRYDTLAPVIDAQAFVAEDATVIGAVTLEHGASVWPQAVLRMHRSAADYVTKGQAYREKLVRIS